IPETDAAGGQILVSVPLPGREVALRVWRIQVGRVPLYLLDANIPQNRPEDRAITAQLYGGDQHTRIQQEIILGIGGIRALRAIGKEPTVCHMNEGHAAFVGLERVRILMDEQKLDFATWRRVEQIPDAELWRTHERCRERLIALARVRLKAQLKRRGAPPAEVDAADEVLDPDALTIGFARRFATYKRGDLLFRDLD